MKVLAAVLVLSLFTTLCAVNPYDPSSCIKQKRGKFVVVKDRNGDDRIVVCVQQHGKYRWELFKGHSYGNYFDPAKDCSAVVDNVPNAKSGIYWIQTKKWPIKAWCDVDTDNGGFILIGVKDTPETWAIPSNFSLVHPEGPARWSTAFGDINVLDFRVQVSTSKDFHDTRAHWYYRFKSPRMLSNLLMSNEGGCSYKYPGIGNISYVKDLMTKNIATRNFSCSLFGASIAPGLGWVCGELYSSPTVFFHNPACDFILQINLFPIFSFHEDKMNKCFKLPCPAGFAYLHNYHVDRSGSYSYSVKSASSGIHNSQTSFIGCDHGKCCACFGPDSKKDYCAPKCKAINGGTVLKKEDNITVWFWVRSSLPKRVWKQCMEFKEKNDAGKMETWRVEDGVRRKGPCSVSDDVTINDGVAVVANNGSMNKLPKVEGLLSYRSDDKKLYLNEKSRWEALANQKEVKDVMGKLESFKQEINNKIAMMNSQSEKKKKDATQVFNKFKKQVANKFSSMNNKMTMVDKKFTTVNKKLTTVNNKFTTTNNKFTRVDKKFETINNKFTTMNNKFATVNKDVQTLTHQSCKQIWMSRSNKGSGVYKLRVGKSQVVNAYCHMSSISGCSDGGWTLVMKVNGASSTFRYHSSYWSNRATYYDNSYGLNGGLDSRQFKGSTYWRTSFKEICVGMRYGGRFTAFSFSYPASSLYDLIADGRYRETHLGRSKWKSLIYRSSLQRHCNREGFNLYVNSKHGRIRLGLIGNQENDCNTPDSFIGVGSHGNHCAYSHSPNAAGNLAQCSADYGNKNARAMAYILVR